MSNAAFSNTRLSWLMGILLMALMNLAGCNGIDKAHWTEEVRLHDGQMIVVERWASRAHSGFPNAPRGRQIDHELFYVPMNVRWHGLGPRRPISFDIFNGTPYLALYAEGRDFCKGKGSKAYKAQFFRWQSRAWVEISQTQFPANDALMNLDTQYWGSTEKEDPRGLVRWEEKAGRNSFYPDKPDTVQGWYEASHDLCEWPN